MRYIANDGTIFDDIKDCVAYERDINIKNITKSGLTNTLMFAQIKQLKFSSKNVDCAEQMMIVQLQKVSKHAMKT